MTPWLLSLLAVALLGPLPLLRHALSPISYLWAVLGAHESATIAVTPVGVFLVGLAEWLFGRIRRHRGSLWSSDMP